MNLSDFCIRRPVFTTVIMLILIVVGIVSFTYLSVRLYPQVDKPVITVTTHYEGASPEIIEIQITRPLEGALAGIEGLDSITSVSQREESKITLNFNPDRDIDSAASDVRDKLGRIGGRLPKEADAPNIRKADIDADPIVYVALTSEEIVLTDLYDYADKFLINQFEAVNGVANVEIYGASPYTMHIWLDPKKLGAYSLTPADVTEALVQQNVEIPAGRLISKDREFMVTTSANLKTPEDFNNLVLKESKGYLVRLKDVGYAEFSSHDERTYVTLNGKQAIGIEIVKKSTANPLELAREIYRSLPNIERTLPKHMKLQIAFDRTIYIENSIQEVYKTLGEATVLVILVIFIFLWSFRGSLIPLVTIPVSLIATFSLLYFFSFSVNTLTLLALVLAIGLVVDDAIVMLENIYRHLENGLSPLKAAQKGSKEITFAVIAMTLTLAAVYLPISLSKDMIGKTFTEFALTLAGAVLISGFVALTLSPMMCSRLLVTPDAKHISPNIRILNWIDEKYALLLRNVIPFKWIVVCFGVAIGLSGWALVHFSLKRELVPPDDKGFVMGKADAPQNATLPFIIPYVQQIENIFKQVPEVETQFTFVNVPSVLSYNILKPWNKRNITVSKIMEKLKPQLWDITGINAYPSGGGSFFGSSGAASGAFSFVVETTKPFEDLIEMGTLVYSLISKNPGIGRTEMDIRPDAVEYIISIDRNKAESAGITEDAIGKTLDTLVSGRVVTKLKEEGHQYDVRAQLIGEARQTPQDMNHVYLRGKVGNDTRMIPLSTIADVTQRSVPTEINHTNQMRSLTFTAELRNGYSLGEAVDFINAVADKVLPDDFQLEFSGETKRFLDSQYTLFLIFALALIFIYLVMAAQFESFRDPLIIMFSVPLSLTGGLLLLWATGGTLNIFSQIGLVTLIGLITKHGILIVDFANKLRETKHLTKEEAIIEAARLRLRPILMTTAAMVFGALPLAFASGAGALSRQQIGWVVVGGMTFGTLLTLFVVPTVYLILSPRQRKAS